MSFPFELEIRSPDHYLLHRHGRSLMWLTELQLTYECPWGNFRALMSSSVTDNCGFEFARVLFMNPSEECHPPLPSSDAFGPEKWATNFQMVPTIHPARCVKIIVCLVTSTGWSLPMAGLCVSLCCTGRVVCIYFADTTRLRCVLGYFPAVFTIIVGAIQSIIIRASVQQTGRRRSHHQSWSPRRHFL